MTRLLAAALLLAGCAPAPKPKPTPEPMPQWMGARVACIDHKGKHVVCNYTVDPSGQVVVSRPDGFVVVKGAEQVVTRDEPKPTPVCSAAPDEIADLKRRVAELEGQHIQPPEWVDVRDLASGAISVRMSGEKGITIHHDGGSWCNVWADDKGLHWEACK